MKITYINHSGFLIETRDCYYIFDYYKGELSNLDKEKEVIVFCSHFHKDHFNPQIFGILDDMGMTYQAVLANDIRKRNHLSDLKITYVYHDQTYNLDNGTQVDTLLSNDSGVAFIVKTMMMKENELPYSMASFKEIMASTYIAKLIFNKWSP